METKDEGLSLLPMLFDDLCVVEWGVGNWGDFVLLLAGVAEIWDREGDPLVVPATECKQPDSQLKKMKTKTLCAFCYTKQVDNIVYKNK